MTRHSSPRLSPAAERCPPNALAPAMLAALALLWCGCGKADPPARKAPATKPAPAAPDAAKPTAPATDPDAGVRSATGAPDAAAAAAKTASDAAVAKAAPADVPPAEPAPPASPLAAADKTVAVALTSPEAIGDAVRTADDLEKWLSANGEHEDAAKVTETAARLRLFAAAASLGLDTDAARKALGGDSGASSQLEKAAKLLEGAESSLALAVTALRGVDPEIKGASFDRAKVAALIRSGTPEGAAVATGWLLRIEQALVGVRSAAPELHGLLLLRGAGRLLCDTCADAHHVTADKVSRFLLNPSNKGGAVCDAALNRGHEARTPEAQIGALSSCREELGLDEGAEPAVYWSANYPLIALMKLGTTLAAEAKAAEPLAAPLKKRIAAAAKALTGGVALPAALVVAPLSADGKRASDESLVSAAGLGHGGLSVDKVALDTFVVGPKSVKGGLAAAVAFSDDGTLRSLSADAKLPAGGVAAISLEALAKTKADPKTGAVALISTNAEQVKAAVDGLAEKVSPAPYKGDEAGRVANLFVDAEAPGDAVVKTIDSLRTSGYRHFRFAKTARMGHSLPLVVRDASPELAKRMGVAHERPIIVAVGAKYADVWKPSKRIGDGAGDKSAKLPDGSTPGFKGKDLRRLRISIGDDGLDAAATASVQGAIEYFEKRYAAGRMVHVVAKDEARAADVLRVAAAYQERKGKVIEGFEAVFAGTRCGGDDYKRLGREPSGCPTGIAVGFSKIDVPSSRGLTSKVEKKEEAPKKEKPAAGFCDRKDIRRGVRKRTGAIRFCYERELQLKKSLSGKIVVKFRIGKSGQIVGEPSVASATLKDKKVQACVLKNVAKMKFSPPEGGTCVVRYPFKFQPR